MPDIGTVTYIMSEGCPYCWYINVLGSGWDWCQTSAI